MDRLAKLCTPSRLYFILGILGLIISFIYDKNNSGSNNVLCLGKVRCPVQHKPSFFLVNLLIIFFWTWVLNSLCKAGYKTLSWILFLLPYILMFIMAFMVVNLLVRYQPVY